MTTHTQGESATIYQFPARGRFAAAALRDEPRPQGLSTVQRLVPAAVGGAWYHDEAIRDAEQPRKN